MNKIFPQEDANGNAAAGSKALPGGEANGSPCCCSRRGACLSAFLMLLLTTLAALIALVAILGPPPRTPGAQACVTQTNRTGFLCDDRSSCIPASRVCDGVRTCARGEDEEQALCRAVPQSLPGFLVAHCGDPASWIYSDQGLPARSAALGGGAAPRLSSDTAAVSPGASAGIVCSIAPTGPTSTPVLALTESPRPERAAGWNGAANPSHVP